MTPRWIVMNPDLLGKLNVGFLHQFLSDKVNYLPRYVPIVLLALAMSPTETSM